MKQPFFKVLSVFILVTAPLLMMQSCDPLEKKDIIGAVYSDIDIDPVLEYLHDYSGVRDGDVNSLGWVFNWCNGADIYQPYYHANSNHYNPETGLYYLETEPVIQYYDFIKIMDKRTLCIYSSIPLRRYGSSDGELLCTIDGGDGPGKFALYGTNPKYFEYQREGDDLIFEYVENGNLLKGTLRIVDDGLIVMGADGGKLNKIENYYTVK